MKNTDKTIYYKYRSLENFRNFVDIILNNRVYAASYKNFEDTKEGHYYYHKGELDAAYINKLREEKNNLKICSLSKHNDISKMWSHYADENKGVAIKLRVTDKVARLKEITYKGLPSINDISNKPNIAEEILSYKKVEFSYEDEMRIFVEGKNNVDVEIIEIILGSRIKKEDETLIRHLVEKLKLNIEIKEQKQLEKTN